MSGKNSLQSPVRNPLTRFFGVVFLLAGLMSPAYGTVYYIDKAATGLPEDGSSWSQAFRTIPTAVTKATGEFWVAAGLYTNSVAMDIKANNIFYGGFTSGMSVLSQRDWIVNRTICDGRSAGYTVLNKSGSGPVTLDGFIIQNGVAGSGGGMNVTGPGALTVNNCVFSNNVATARGGAIVLENDDLNAFFSNCVFIANSQSGNTDGGGAIRGHSALTNNATFWDCSFVANRTGRGSGGAISAKAGLYILTRCTFTSNFSVTAGGAINGSLQLRMKDCDFIGNISTNGGGGAIYRQSANGTNFFQNCAFIGNAATNGGTGGGGAICETVMASYTFLNCTFFSNTTTHITAGNAPGGAIRAAIANSVLNITNCIFWGNTSSAGANAQEIAPNGANEILNISYTAINTNAILTVASTVKNYGSGITNVNPQFASATVPYDIHLKSTGGRWDPGLSNWVKDDVSSPCIDAGDASDYSLEPLPNGGIINLGRYGNTLYASKTPGGSSSRTGTLVVVR